MCHNRTPAPQQTASLFDIATRRRAPTSSGAGDTLVASFMAKCDQVMLAEGCDRTEAMRRGA
jgi:hypothetical protein